MFKEHCCKIILRSLIVIIVFMNIDCFPANNKKEIFEKSFPGYSLLHYRKGNFLDSKTDEYIIFLKNKNKYQGLSPKDYEEVSKINDIDKVVVVKYSNNKILQTYTLDIRSGEYDENWIKCITKGNPQFGDWDGYCYVNDFNENGLDEIVFFVLSGRAFLPYIFEFKDLKMQVVLNPPPFERIGMTEITTPNEKGKKVIKIYGYGLSNTPANKRDWYKYTWDAKARSYVIIEQGVE